jgi:FMN phosphatase YigB (HAD superfamily)
MIKVAVFDAFNTVVRRDMKYVSEPYKLVQERATLKTFNPMASSLSLREYADAIGAVYTEKEWIKIEGDMQIELAHITEYSDSKSVMQELKKLGIVIAIGSNLAPEYGPRLKQIFGDLVDEYYFSYEMQLKKPQVEYYHHIENDMQAKQYVDGINPAEISWLAIISSMII